MVVSDFEHRRNTILDAIIQTYINAGVPVGSEALLQQYQLGVSAATIRNVMSDLEAAGYIMHPHTSAGRVPTDKGYRYYVNTLAEHRRLTPAEQQAMDRGFGHETGDVDALMSQALDVLSQMTHQASVGLAPELKRDTFKRLELIPISGARLMGVLITREGVVRSHLIELDETMEAQEITRLLRFMNAELDGMMLDSIEEFLTRRLLEETDMFFHLLKRATDIVRLTLAQDERDELYLAGTGYLLAQPEFQDMARTRALLQLLEERVELLELLRGNLEAGPQVAIGRENVYDQMRECALISVPYRIRNKVLGRIAVLGPRRMDYPRVLAQLTALAGRLSEQLNRLAEM